MRRPVLGIVVAGMMAWAAEPPREWVERESGRRVIRLSEKAGETSFYFHQNAYTSAGDKLLIGSAERLAAVDWKTRKVETVVEGRTSQVVVGGRSRTVFYLRDGAIWATHIDTKDTRRIAAFPKEFRPGSGLTVNADETLLAGSLVEGNPPSVSGPPPAPGQTAERREMSLEARWRARWPMRLYTVNIRTGEFRTFHPSGDWLNHVQFSPADAGLLMFCHEGPWHMVDRIWTIRVDGSGLTKIHTRTMEMEIAGHEFFAADGKTIWYDLQTPRSKVFWLAGYVLRTGEKIRYPVAREHWSVHFNVSRDGRWFAGDGGGPRSVAAPGNGQWIYRFTPKGGKLEVERLVDLAKHDYALEPNVTFTPDGNWIVFRSNLHGAAHTYAVEVAGR